MSWSCHKVGGAREVSEDEGGGKRTKASEGSTIFLSVISRALLHHRTTP